MQVKVLLVSSPMIIKNTKEEKVKVKKGLLGEQQRHQKEWNGRFLLQYLLDSGTQSNSHLCIYLKLKKIPFIHFYLLVKLCVSVLYYFSFENIFPLVGVFHGL